MLSGCIQSEKLEQSEVRETEPLSSVAGGGPSPQLCCAGPRVHLSSSPTALYVCPVNSWTSQTQDVAPGSHSYLTSVRPCH